MKTTLITMENAALTLNHCQRVTAWIREHVPSAHPSLVSHTKVKVLSRTQSTVPKCPVPDRSLFDRPLDEKWTEDGPELGSHSETRCCVKRTAIQAADETFNITSHTQGGREDDEHTTPSSCFCLPLKMPIHRWGRRRQSKVAPLSFQIPPDKNIKLMRVDDEEATPVIHITPDITPFCLGDGSTQKNPTPEVATIAPKPGIPTLFGVVTTEMDTPGQESQTIFEVVSKGMEQQEFPTLMEVTKTVKDPPLQKHRCIWKVVPALSVDDQQEKITKNENHIFLSRESVDPLRPKTSHGFKQDLDLEFPTEKIRGDDSMVNVWTREEDKQEDVDTDYQNLVPSGLEIKKSLANENHITFDLSRDSVDSLRPKTSHGFKQGDDSIVNVWDRGEDKQEEDSDSDYRNLVPSGFGINPACDAVSGETNIFTNTDESDGENTDSSELADLQSSNDENDNWEQIEEAVTASRMSSRMDVENQREEFRELSKGGERGNDEVCEEEIQYELNQREHWQLAAVGEWSVICQDDDELNDDNQSYLMKDEFQKEQEIREDWKLILDRYQSLSIIQDLRTMQTLSKCTINQSERAMRQFARICRGPVPLSHSGQTKVEAIASLSRKVHQQTKRISEDISNTFMEFYHIFEEMDALREKQDQVEEFFQKDFEKKDSEESRASALPARSATPRRSSSRLHQWELDMDLMDIYSEGKVKSSSLITVMPTIEENEIYFVPDRRSCSRLSRQSNECQESDDSDAFPEYPGMDCVSPRESDVTPVADTDNRDADVTFTESTEDSVKTDER